MNKVVLRTLSRLKLIDRFSTKVVGKNGIKVPVIGGLGYDNVAGMEKWEKWMSQILEMLLSKFEGCFIDVGVNIGQTLIKVKSIDRNIDYLGFEPNPICVFYVERLISANKFPNAKVIPAGISNTTEIVTLKYFAEDTTDSSASIIADFRPNEKVVQEKSIVVINGDLITIDKKIGTMKVDVEGAELMVIQGLRKFIERDRPPIVIEILPVYTAENKQRLERQQAILKILAELDYIVLKIMKSPDGTLRELTPIEDIGIHGDIVHSDYIFMPRESAGKIGH